jgi:hypothetical protein
MHSYVLICSMSKEGHCFYVHLQVRLGVVFLTLLCSLIGFAVAVSAPGDMAAALDAETDDTHLALGQCNMHYTFRSQHNRCECDGGAHLRRSLGTDLAGWRARRAFKASAGGE